MQSIETVQSRNHHGYGIYYDDVDIVNRVTYQKETGVQDGN